MPAVNYTLAVKIRCFDAKCRGVPFSVNTPASRLAEHFGRSHYQCDTCRQTWSIDTREYGKQLEVRRPVRNLR